MRLTLALVLTLGAPSGDRWFGADKLKHFVVAGALQSAAYAVWRQSSDDRRQALWKATAVTSTVSLGKEWWDRRQGRDFSARDLAWDAAGAGVSTLAIIHWRGR